MNESAAPAERKPTDKLTVSVPDGFRARLNAFAQKSGMKVSTIVVRAVTRYIMQAERMARAQSGQGMGDI
jgi:hypothetical protein